MSENRTTDRSMRAPGQVAAVDAALNDFRRAALGARVRPTAELGSRLDLRILKELDAVPRTDVAQYWAVSEPVAPSKRGKVKTMLTWISGLGLAGKIVLGLGIAAIATAGASAAAMIPPAPQSVSETTITPESTDAPEDDTDSVEDAPDEGSDSFGESVSERAHELGKGSDGRSFGEEISTEAKLNGSKDLEEGNDNSDEATSPDDTEARDTNDKGKPEGTPGGNPNK